MFGYPMMLTRFFPSLACLLLASIAAAQSWRTDQRYIRSFRHGYGADALAFQFDRAGRLLRAPAYIAQAQLNNFYISRLGIFIRGKSTPAEVQSIFGRFRRVEQRRDGFIGYHEIEVYNPFEDNWGRGKT